MKVPQFGGELRTAEDTMRTFRPAVAAQVMSAPPSIPIRSHPAAILRAKL